ncbi:MAG: YoeB-YefM toxin-antitoxin system antitoxin YefM [Betaproteobacteria bacterium]|nr:YoeB-YefM toxin-antitoxin system antitoxin YefM [Betaproteobacteria bacterium]
MRTVSYSEARQNFSTTMNSAINDRVPVLITRQRGGNCVLISQEDFEAMEETAYLLRSPENAKRLLQSVERVRSGEGSVTRRIEDLEAMEHNADQV